MSSYVRETPFEIDFQGDKVTGVIKPLLAADLLVVTGADVNTDEDAGQQLTRLVPAYVVNFVGPKALDGSAVTLEEVCSVAYFVGLAAQMGRKLLEAALPPQKPSEISAS
jgi:hypothetical protein